MIDERMTAEEMSKRYPNQWLFIIQPKTRKNVTHLVSAVVQVHSKSRDDVYETSRKFKADAAISWTGDDTSQERSPKMPLYRPRNLQLIS